MFDKKMDRRQFLHTGSRVAGVAIIPAVLLDSAPALAQELPLISPTDPTAIALGYFEDASQVDTTRYPQRATPEGKQQFCHNCVLYTGAPDAESGPCAIFPGKSVKADGWCSVWAARPA